MGALLVQWSLGPPVPKTITEANNPDTAARQNNREREGEGDTETERKGERGRGDSKGDSHSRNLECGGHRERHQAAEEGSQGDRRLGKTWCPAVLPHTLER